LLRKQPTSTRNRALVGDTPQQNATDQGDKLKASDINNLSAKMGGATLTKIARSNDLQHMQNTLKAAGRANFKLENMKAKDVHVYMKSQLDAGISKRTLQNEATSLRTTLRAMGRTELADSERLSSKALGIDGANRDGTHRALTSEEYSRALEAAQERHSGFAACLQLQRELGLRQREAIQSVDSLKTWQKAIERGDSVRISHGTKGGRVRDTMPIDRDRALEAVKTAIEAAKENGGTLIPSKSLEGAARAYQRLCADVGLKGELASHALRYTFAQEKMAQNLEYTFGDRAEALALTSLELGHGDGRGTYVDQVYLR
jgi:site-specific recombinase XerD